MEGASAPTIIIMMNTVQGWMHAWMHGGINGATG